MMSSIYNPDCRVIPQIAAEHEWAYLVNETLEGERAIVPLLKDLMKGDVRSLALYKTLELQLDEEISHVRGYHAIVGRAGLKPTSFGEDLKSYVSKLPKVTLKIFSLQTMLEGIALGALQHRLKYWVDSPSTLMDKSAYIDEEKHVGLSWDHFRELMEYEGAISIENFRNVEKDINFIFKKAFSGESLIEWINSNFPGKYLSDPLLIERSEGIRLFRSKSAQTLVETKKNFQKYYKLAALDYAS